MRLKRFLNKFGYDVKKYHPTFATTIRPLGINTVIDIGANIGLFAKHMRTEFPTAMIYAFEPLGDCFAQMTQSFIGDPHFKGFKLALGETKGQSVIERSSFHPSSSLRHMSDLHKTLYPKSKDARPETIEIDRLDDVLANVSFTEKILVKIDVQGYEDKVLAGGANVMKRASVAIIESSFVPLYEGQPLFNDICQRMNELGFSYYGDMGRHHSRITGKLLYEDALFLKKELMSA